MPGDSSQLLSRAALLELFGLTSDATKSELRAAYHLRMRQLARSDHGELGDPQTRTHATLLALAYDALSRNWPHMDESSFAQD